MADVGTCQTFFFSSAIVLHRAILEETYFNLAKCQFQTFQSSSAEMLTEMMMGLSASKNVCAYQGRGQKAENCRPLLTATWQLSNQISALLFI